MQWPEKPTCHAAYPGIAPQWRPATPDGSPYAPGSEHRGPHAEPFRTCSYCGSMHPEDLLGWMQRGAQLHGSDWKYGWPHKFYVEGIPNPIAGQTVQMGSRSTIDLAERLTHEPIMGAAPATTFAKWYNDHLIDDGYDDEAWNALVEALAERAGILFSRDPERGLMYRAPYGGYQR